MSTRLEFTPAPEWNIDGKISFTYEGADTADKGPAGSLLRMFLAQLSQDEAALKATVTEKTLSTMGKPSAPGKDLGVKIKEPTYEGDDKATAIVPTDLMTDGQPQELPFVLVKEDSGWKVDMPATMQRMMGFSMEQLSSAFEEGMKQMAEGMKGVMEGVGEAMSQAFSGGDSSGETAQLEDAPPTHPDLAAFRQEMIHRLGIKWNVRADEGEFAYANPELLKDVLDALFAGVIKFSRAGGIGHLEAVQTLEIKKGAGPGRFDREGQTLIYTVGETEDGRADFYDSANSSRPLAAALEGITQ